MAKPLKVAGEVDSWCTKCRLVLNHRIVSMKNGKAYQVECLTCRSHPPLARARARREGRARRAEGARAPRAVVGGAQVDARHARDAARADRGRRPSPGAAVNEFKAYNVGANFREGDLLRHKKFGDGVVTRVIDAHKVEVLFRDEAKTLAQGMT